VNATANSSSKTGDPVRSGARTDQFERAIASAGHHARAAAAETLLLLRALLDVAGLLALGRGASEIDALRSAVELLEQVSQELRPDGDPARDLLADLADVLDAEIARWEALSRDDDEARAVYRAFLGLRELLWELGAIRGPAESTSTRATA